MLIIGDERRSLYKVPKKTTYKRTTALKEENDFFPQDRYLVLDV